VSDMYNYVILGSDKEIFKTSFKDVSTLDNVRYIEKYSLPQNAIFRTLYKIHNSRKVNGYVKLPFKNIWNRIRVNFSFSKKRKVCFILFSDYLRTANETKLIEYLRKEYQGCKIVWFAQDIINTIKGYYSNKPLDINDLKNNLDFAISYDMGDSAKYGFAYHPTVLSKIELQNVSDVPAYDVYFLALPKGRLVALVELCKKFTQVGLKCGFYMLGVPEKERIYVDGLYYLDKPLNYIDNLKIASKSRCLLELMQPGAVGYTFRTSEALLYGKILITDNLAVKDAPFYNPEDIYVVDELDNNIENLVRKIKAGEKTNYQNVDVISPKHFLDFVEKSLN